MSKLRWDQPRATPIGVDTWDFPECAKRTLTYLRKHFPDAFRVCKPLKLGIHNDLRARSELDEHQISYFMTRYVRLPVYLKACARAGAQRHDLDGNPVAEVSEEDRAYAQSQVHSAEHPWSSAPAPTPIDDDCSLYARFKRQLLEPVVITDKYDPDERRGRSKC